jgi:hypothetical protein
VLAVAGAGLFAIAAIVFTFFNPDLTDHVLRSVIVGLVTIPFLGGAWLLARRDLQFSAEAVGALGMVFVGLDVYAVSELAPTGISAWLFAALGTLVAGGIMAVAGAVRRVRTWLWVSVVALTAVPAMVGYSGHTSLTSVLGHLGAVIAAIVAIEGIQVVSRRFSSALTVEKITLTVLQLAAVAAVVLQVGAIDANSVTAYWVTVALLPVVWRATRGAPSPVPRRSPRSSRFRSHWISTSRSGIWRSCPPPVRSCFRRSVPSSVFHRRSPGRRSRSRSLWLRRSP